MIKFTPNLTSISECIIILCSSLGSMGFCYFYKLDWFICLLAIVPCFMATCYGVLKILPRKIIKNENGFFLKYGPYKCRLVEGKFKVCYEKVFVLSAAITPEYGLVLYRDFNKLISLSLNNKIVLKYDMNEIKIGLYKKEFEKIGVEIYNASDLF